MLIWCIQKVAELKEEDIISYTVAATDLPEAADRYLPTNTALHLPTVVTADVPTVTTTVFGDYSETLGEKFIIKSKSKLINYIQV